VHFVCNVNTCRLGQYFMPSFGFYLQGRTVGGPPNYLLQSVNAIPIFGTHNLGRWYLCYHVSINLGARLTTPVTTVSCSSSYKSLFSGEATAAVITTPFKLQDFILFGVRIDRFVMRASELCRTVFLNRRTAAPYRALASIILGPCLIEKRIYWAADSQSLSTTDVEYMNKLSCLLLFLSHSRSSTCLRNVASIFRVHVAPKRWLTRDPHGATSQKTAFFIVTAVKASNLK
jgi:hypothetical protein